MSEGGMSKMECGESKPSRAVAAARLLLPRLTGTQPVEIADAPEDHRDRPPAPAPPAA